MLATDNVTLGDVRVNDAGYLEGFARTARTGIQHYTGREMGRPDLGMVSVYRDEADVFSHTALHSFSKIPLCIDHPPEAVTAANWKKYAVGTTGDEVLREGQHLKIGLKITDSDAVRAIQSGKRELSVGYQTKIVWGDGVTEDGQHYQARQTAIVANHIAIVSAGRAGPQCRIGDSWTDNPSQPTEPPMNLQKVTVDGITVEMSDTAAQVVSKLQDQLRTMQTSLSTKDAAIETAKADAGRALSAKDGEVDALKASHVAALSAKDGEIDVLKSKMPDAAALDAMLVQRSATIDSARKMLGDSFDPKGKSDADIRRAAVVKAMGDAAKDRDDAYIAAAFDALAIKTPAQMRRDPVRDAIRDPGRQTETNDARGAHADMLKRLSGGWQQNLAKETA